MRTRHEATDNYVMQSYVQGKWVTDRKVRKAGSCNSARVSAKKTGVSHRVFNTTKNVVYCEAIP